MNEFANSISFDLFRSLARRSALESRSASRANRARVAIASTPRRAVAATPDRIARVARRAIGYMNQ
jgi:hypothetical protein